MYLLSGSGLQVLLGSTSKRKENLWIDGLRCQDWSFLAVDVKIQQIIKLLFNMSNTENGEEENRFCLLFSFKIKLLIHLPRVEPGANMSEEFITLLVAFSMIMHCSSCQHLVIIQKALSTEVFDRL